MRIYLFFPIALSLVLPAALAELQTGRAKNSARLTLAMSLSLSAPVLSRYA